MAIISTPLPDLELAVPRAELEYKLALPPQGVGQQTGLIVYIHGFGARFDDPYACKLLPHLAEKYDCVAVSIDYHGAAD
jgi:pimeloyl-ACP methyl ester carboxylesterase